MQAEGARQRGPDRLERLCAKLLVRCRDGLGDVGDTPQVLLEPILVHCDAGHLACIEQETRCA